VAAPGPLIPADLSPLGAVVTLERFLQQGSLDQAARDSLLRDIADLQRRYFGPGAGAQANGDLNAIVSRWASALGKPEQ
jgi:hypothetical protein